jgi:hypothetical protein
MKVQSSIFALVLVITSFASALPSEAKGSSGGGSRSSSSSSSSSRSSSFGSSNRSSGSSSGFGSSSRSTTSSTGTKSQASAFSRGPSAATTKVAATKAQSLNTSAKPLTQSQLTSSGVKSAKPSELGMSSTDTTRLAAMQTQHNALQNIPVSQRNASNPVYVQQQATYDRDRVIFIQSHPTTYIPVYGSSYGPYDGGYVRHIEPADDSSGFENFLNGFLTFLLWMCGIGLGSFAIYKLVMFVIERNEEIKAEKLRIEREQERF